MILAPGFGVPVVGVPLLALFAMQVGVDGHAFGCFQFIDQVVSARPVAFPVPPEGLDWSGEAGWRLIAGDAGFEFGWIHDGDPFCKIVNPKDRILPAG